MIACRNFFDKPKNQPPELFYRKKVFLKNFQNLQGNNRAKVSILIKLQASLPADCFIFQVVIIREASYRFP